MKERPILMNDAMVRATLRDVDPKGQTRRIIKDQPDDRDQLWRYEDGWLMFRRAGIGWTRDQRCPYGQPGDRLWVREAWTPEPRGRGFNDQRVIYRADMLCMPRTMDYDAKAMLADPWLGPPSALKWKPSIHMRRNASRILLEITAVRVERVQDITDADAEAEGWPGFDITPLDSRSWFEELWREINGADNWHADPWVWVIEFKRVNQ